ncbi:hypothetical protein ACIO6U_02805 [Streptomyces sp. NPDC087422]|uniref:hypothetical protein n=1 Tax=Streptomyces sp. NPDC087422 TaxID=3365786 RepID=UPI00380C44A2
MTRQNVALVAALATAALTLAGCGGRASDDAKADPSGTATAATVTPTTESATTAPAVTVKLSTKWAPKLKTLSDGPGVIACQDSGSTGCVNAMTDAINAYGGIVKDINNAGASDEYAKTLANINQYVRAADAFDKAGCAGDPNADVGDSPCSGDAMKVVMGSTLLGFVMPTDEMNAGVG